ncbi:MAG TPA: oxidoreductase [Gammaproteobacteria bacterium]|nr:oxidoreductase [Gammaproteobacteria bacterium]
MFNTLGNFTSYPHAGLVFFDFDRGKVLQLCGRPEIYSQQADEPGESDGTARFWEFQIECWRESNLPIQVKSRFVDYSPFLPRTCKPDSTQAKQTLLLKVAHTWMASPRIKCFELVSENGAPLPPFHAGAHLTLDLPIRQGSLETRHYSLLSDPACRTYYRIGVLAEPHGRGGSLYLHQQIRAGDTLRAQTPVNHFQLTPGARHSILIAGGIGITPLLSMLYTLKSENRSFELHYSAKQPPDLAFRREIEKLAGPQAHFYTSQNPSQASLDLESIINTPVAHAHIYVCGPYRLIQTVRMQASTMGWLPEQIHFESFGATNTASDQAITVTLAKTGRTIHIPAKRSILDALLDEGIAVPHECKRGECSLCVTRVLKGNVQHRDLCLNPDEQKNAMCLCVSRTSTPYLTLDL